MEVTGSNPPRAAGLRVAMALYGDVTYDSRVQREAETLCRAGHDVTIYCLAGSPLPGSSFRVVTHRPSLTSVLPDGNGPFLRMRRSSLIGRIVVRVSWIVGYARNLRSWGRRVMDIAGVVDVWHAHDITGLLAVGPLVRPPVRLVYDSHEICMETGTPRRLPRPLRGLLAASEGRLARRAFALVTVSNAYAGVLRRRLRPRETVVVRNCPPRWTPGKQSSPLRGMAGVADGCALVLYHGALSPHRGAEQLAEAMLRPGLDTAHVVFLGFGEIRDEIAELGRDPRFGGRLHLLEPVPPSDVLSFVSGADVDVIALQHSTLNHWLCTPNKLWESLAAGVPVLVSDFPAMRSIVLDNPDGPLGSVCDPADPGSIADAIRTIVELSLAERHALRERCLRAAHERWNWETESARLVSLYADLLSTV